MTDIMTCQNIDLSSWDTLYIYIYINCNVRKSVVSWAEARGQST